MSQKSIFIIVILVLLEKRVYCGLTIKADLLNIAIRLEFYVVVLSDIFYIYILVY